MKNLIPPMFCLWFACCNSLVGELDRIQKKYDSTGNAGDKPAVRTIEILYPHNNRGLFFVDWPYTYAPVLSEAFKSCAATPELPAGLTLDATSCAITGTPVTAQAASSYTITATATGKTGTASVSLTVIGMSASRVYGQPDFVSGSVGVTDADTLANPLGLAVTGAGVYVADTAFQRVLFYNGNSTVATSVYGQPDFLASTFPLNPNAASLKLPRGVTVDVNGKIWIADRANHRVLRYTPGQSSADGLIGQTAYNLGVSGGCTQQSLNAPDAVATDANGVYVADTLNNRVLYFPTLNPGTSLPMASRVYGQSSYSVCTTNAGGVNATSLNAPTSLAVAADGVYISDRTNNRVLFFPGNDTTATRVYGQPDLLSSGFTPSADGLNSPRGIAATEFGVFIADAGYNRVLFYRGHETTASVVFGQNLSFTSVGANPGGIAAQYLSTPVGVAFRDGLYILDMNNNRLLFY